jgi:hypothetical protein
MQELVIEALVMMVVYQEFVRPTGAWELRMPITDHPRLYAMPDSTTRSASLPCKISQLHAAQDDDGDQNSVEIHKPAHIPCMRSCMFLGCDMRSVAE